MYFGTSFKMHCAVFHSQNHRVSSTILLLNIIFIVDRSLE